MRRRAVDHLAARISSAGIWHDLIPLVAKPVEFCLHAPEEEFRRSRVDPGPLQAQDVGPLPFDLFSHMIDFAKNSVDAHAAHPDLSP